MSARVWLALCALGALTLGCGDPDGAAVGAQGGEAATPSPITEADAERIYTMLTLANVYAPICDGYFESPSDPRHMIRATMCESYALEQVDWLRANGFASASVEYVRSREFWEPQKRVRARIQRCLDEARAAAADYHDRNERSKHCNPVRRVPVKSNGVPSAESAGFTRPS